MKVGKAVIVLGLMVAVLSTLCVAEDFVGNREMFVGDGLRINVASGGTYQIYADEPVWVQHGWYQPEQYPGMVADLLKETGNVESPGGWYFKLQINGKPVRLAHDVLMFLLDEPGEWGRYWTWYVQFPAGYFKPGVYAFRGEWGCRNPRNSLNTLGIVPSVHYATLIVLEPEP